VEAHICVALLDARLLFREHGIGFAGVYSTLHKTCESSVAIHCLSGCQSEGFFRVAGYNTAEGLREPRNAK
jgi:hypothetical protein